MGSYQLIGEAGFQQQWAELKRRIDAVERHTANEMPSGSINAFGGSAAPSGWLLCDGSAISRTTYNQLFDAIGTTYGTGDGSTTFNVPNLNASRFPRGSTSGGGSGGASTHQHTMSHTHGLSDSGGAQIGGSDDSLYWNNGAQTFNGDFKALNIGTFQTNNGKPAVGLVGNTDGSSAANTGSESTLPLYQDVRFIIKI